MHYFRFLALLLIVVSAGCRKEFPQIEGPDNQLIGSFSTEFETFWQGMNNQYVFWDRDPTDWDAVYREYKPKFAALNINREGDRDKAYYYYREMTANLTDSHFTLATVIAPDGEPSSISPARKRNQQRQDWHPPMNESFFYSNIYWQYLGDESFRSKDSDNYPSLVAGKIFGRNILYFRLPQFNLRQAALYGTKSERAVWQYFKEASKNPQLEGLLLDLRGNGGGYLEDLSFLLGQLVTKPYVFGATRYKSGLGRLDYTAWIPAEIFPQPDAWVFRRPIVVLVDQYSASMSEITAIAIKAFPGGSGTVVGETTWGATGPIANHTIYNSGPFFTSTSYVYTSSHQFRDTRNNSYESTGVPPDVVITQNMDALKNNKDVQLDKAIGLFR